MYFLFLARFFTCEWGLPPHYKWASLTSWTETGLSKPDKLKSRSLETDGSKPDFVLSKQLNPELLEKAGYQRATFPSRLLSSLLHGRLCTSQVCSSKFNREVVLKLVLQNSDARPGKRQTNSYYQSSTFIENLLKKMSTFGTKCKCLEEKKNRFGRTYHEAQNGSVFFFFSSIF